jgi:hypothetical protein
MADSNSMAAGAFREYERFRDWTHTLERFRLGEAIMDSTGYMASDLTRAFREEWFQDPLHRAVFLAIRALIERGARDLDVGMVVAELQRQGTFSKFPNATSYVCSLTDGAVPPPTCQSRLFRLEEMRWAWSELDRAKKGANCG